jgi:anti-sigma-K factor RskA
VNVNDYISSGIVESYVLGLADEAERAEFESMCAAHHEVRAARDAFELSLERQAQMGAVLPSPDLKTRLFAELSIAQAAPFDQDSSEVKKGMSDLNNGLNEPGKGYNEVVPGVKESRVREAKVVTGPGWAKYLAAASVLLLVASTILNFYLFRQYQDYSERYSSLLASQTELANRNSVLQTSVVALQSNMDFLKDPNTSMIKMAGNLVPKNGSPVPSSMATIYWNRKSTEVYLLVNALPKPTSDKQYQLWAIVGGKPVSAGVFDMNSPDTMLKMANIPNAEAFAVTLEKSGGSPTPQGAMYVLGTT